MKRLTALAMALALQAPAAAPAALAADGPGSIRGTLVDAGGQPLAGFKVKVIDASGDVHESEATGPDGRYEISGLPPGTYEYQIVDPEGLLIAVRIPPVTLEAGSVLTQPIAIVPSKKKKGSLVAWIVGGVGAATLAIAAANDDDEKDDGDEPSMTPSGSTGGGT